MSNTTDDQQAILDLFSKWSANLEKKDLQAMMEDYVPDALLFDACPPYKVEGVDNIKQVWQHCLPHFPDTFKSEHRDLQVHVDGNVAFVHGLHHIIPTPADHPCGNTWMRITIGLKRVEGRWKVAHEHVSIPFNPMNKEAWYVTDPDQLEMPDYSQSCS